MTDKNIDLRCDGLSEMIENFGLLIGRPRRLSDNGRPYTLVPEDARLEPLDAFLGDPVRAQAVVKATNVNSFIAYLNEHKTEASRVFASTADRQKVPSVRAIIDYHAAHGTPGWCQHQVLLQIIRSPEWSDWRGIDGHRMNQIDMLEFLEERLPDIQKPDGADVLEVCRDLRAMKNVTFKSAVVLQTGDVRLEYAEDTNAKVGTIEVPEEIELHVPLFEGTDPITVTAKFRYRVEQGGGLAFIVRLLQAADQERKIIETILERITGECNIIVYEGTIDR